MPQKVILSADSTCDLSAALIERYQVHMYPLHILLEGSAVCGWGDLPRCVV